jgi:hypothetical protein
VTRDDIAFGICENRIGKAEGFDRCAYLIDLADCAHHQVLQEIQQNHGLLTVAFSSPEAGKWFGVGGTPGSRTP